MLYHQESRLFELTLPEQAQYQQAQYIGYLSAYDIYLVLGRLLDTGQEEIDDIARRPATGEAFLADSARYHLLRHKVGEAAILRKEMRPVFRTADHYLIQDLETDFPQS